MGFCWEAAERAPLFFWQKRSTGDGRDDGNFILPILQNPNVFLVHENVGEAPDLDVGFADAVLHSRKSLVDVFNQLQYKTPTYGNSLRDDPKFQELVRRVGFIEQ